MRAFREVDGPIRRDCAGSKVMTFVVVDIIYVI